MKKKWRKLKVRWHLPKWAVDFPTPVKRSINLADMDDDALRNIHHFAFLVLLPRCGGTDTKRHAYVWDLLGSINIVYRMSPLERLANAGETQSGNN